MNYLILSVHFIFVHTSPSLHSFPQPHFPISEAAHSQSHHWIADPIPPLSLYHDHLSLPSPYSSIQKLEQDCPQTRCDLSVVTEIVLATILRITNLTQIEEILRRSCKIIWRNVTEVTDTFGGQERIIYGNRNNGKHWCIATSTFLLFHFHWCIFIDKFPFIEDGV